MVHSGDVRGWNKLVGVAKRRRAPLLSRQPVLAVDVREALDQLRVSGHVEDVARHVAANVPRHERFAPKAEQALRGSGSQPVRQNERDVLLQAAPVGARDQT